MTHDIRRWSMILKVGDSNKSSGAEQGLFSGQDAAEI